MTLPTLTSSLLPENAPGTELSLLEDGARYALLQRMTPVIQHQIMGNFQSMDMIAVMLDRRVQSATPDLDSMRQDCGLLASVSESAIKSVIDLLTWVRPKPATTRRFDAGVEECASLLLNDFKLKGFVIANEVTQISQAFSSRTLRTVVSAALVCLSDQTEAPAQFTLRAQVFPDCIKLSIELSMNPDLQELQLTRISHASGLRLMNWRDLELLAAAESVELVHGENSVLLAFKLPSENQKLSAGATTNFQTAVASK